MCVCVCLHLFGDFRHVGCSARIASHAGSGGLRLPAQFGGRSPTLCLTTHDNTSATPRQHVRQHVRQHLDSTRQHFDNTFDNISATCCRVPTTVLSLFDNILSTLLWSIVEVVLRLGNMLFRQHNTSATLDNSSTTLLSRRDNSVVEVWSKCCRVLSGRCRDDRHATFMHVRLIPGATSLETRPTSHAVMAGARTCAICWSALDGGEAVTSMKCGHSLHSLCMKTFADTTKQDVTTMACPSCPSKHTRSNKSGRAQMQKSSKRNQGSRTGRRDGRRRPRRSGAACMRGPRAWCHQARARHRSRSCHASCNRRRWQSWRQRQLRRRRAGGDRCRPASLSPARGALYDLRKHDATRSSQGVAKAVGNMAVPRLPYYDDEIVPLLRAMADIIILYLA